MSSEIQNSICELVQKGAEKWIIDLRFNGGGNMFPMVEGISNIIGDGLLEVQKVLQKKKVLFGKLKMETFFMMNKQLH